MNEAERIEVRAKLKAAISATVEKIVCTINTVDELAANAVITFRDGSIRKLEVKSNGFGISENYDTITIGTTSKNIVGSSFVVSPGGIIPRRRVGLHGKVAAVKNNKPR